MRSARITVPPVIEAILVQPAPKFPLRLCLQDNGHAKRDKSALRRSATPQTRFSFEFVVLPSW